MNTAVDYIANELRGTNRNEVGAGEWAERIVACLSRNGYVIVHPDDMLAGMSIPAAARFAAAEQEPLPMPKSAREHDAELRRIAAAEQETP